MRVFRIFAFNPKKEAHMYRVVCAVALVLFLVSVSATAQPGRCEKVGGVLMTNIGTIPTGASGTNIGDGNVGPAFGDLAGSVTAVMVNNNPFQFQHYWVTASGETILFAKATLTPAPTDDPAVVAVRWGNYRSDIAGGTGKFSGATGYLDYFGIADFAKKTLVLRYSGEVCYQNVSSAVMK